MSADVEQVTYPSFGDPALVDWVDYAQRNDDTDPVGFAEEVLARATPERGIFVVWDGDYRTFEGDCEAMLGVIGAARGGQELVGKNSRFFEDLSVSWFPATA